MILNVSGSSCCISLSPNDRCNKFDILVLQKVEHLQPDGHSLTVLPYLNGTRNKFEFINIAFIYFLGERSPGWNIHARASIVGMSSTTKPEHFIRAGLESVAFNLADIYDLLRSLILQLQPEKSTSFSSHCHIIASGSALENSTLWRQILGAMNIDD